MVSSHEFARSYDVLLCQNLGNFGSPVGILGTLFFRDNWSLQIRKKWSAPFFACTAFQILQYLIWADTSTQRTDHNSTSQHWQQYINKMIQFKPFEKTESGRKRQQKDHLNHFESAEAIMGGSQLIISSIVFAWSNPTTRRLLFSQFKNKYPSCYSNLAALLEYLNNLRPAVGI